MLIRKAHLKFSLDHSYVGDLSVSLVSPKDEKIEIYKGTGSSDQINFDEDVTNKLAGKMGGGDWRLEVFDKAARDQGSLKAFSLTLTPDLFECQAR